MPSSHEDTVTMGARAAQERPITIGKTWRFLAAASVVLGLLALFAWALTRDPKLIPSPLIGKEHPCSPSICSKGGRYGLPTSAAKLWC